MKGVLGNQDSLFHPLKNDKKRGFDMLKDDLDIAWASGVFEGEGCISFEQKAGVRLSVSMSDEDVITRVASTFKAGTVTGPIIRGNNKPMWTWRTGDRDHVRDIIHLMQPFLGNRRLEKAMQALKRLEQNNQPRIAVCGTYSGALRHRRLKEEVCDPCRLVENVRKNEEQKRLRKLRRTKKPDP